MKQLIALLFTTAAFAQNYAAYNNQPVARMSFLRSQWAAGNTFRDSSLINYWPLTRKTDVAYDYSGNGVLGAFKGNSPGYFLSGKVGSFANYNNKSNGNYVGFSSITVTVPFTISAWAAPNAITGGYARVVETNFGTGFYLGTDSTMSKWQMIVNNPSIGTCAVGGTASTAKWSMVTEVYDGVNGYLYVNGALVAGPCAFTAPLAANITNVTMRIGCYNSGSSCASTSSAWDGWISDVRIYERALSAAEVLTIYNAENH